MVHTSTCIRWFRHSTLAWSLNMHSDQCSVTITNTLLSPMHQLQQCQPNVFSRPTMINTHAL